MEECGCVYCMRVVDLSGISRSTCVWFLQSVIDVQIRIDMCVNTSAPVCMCACMLKYPYICILQEKMMIKGNEISKTDIV